MNNPIELPLSFEGTGDVRGWQFKQIFKSLCGHIYEITTISGRTYYEAFKRKVSKNSDAVIQGMNVHFEARVKYPKTDSFGKWGICTRNKETAFEYINSIKQ
jgi:hypothetical protein